MSHKNSGVCKQHQQQGRTFFQAQPVQACEEGKASGVPKQLLNVVPQQSISDCTDRNLPTVPPAHAGLAHQGESEERVKLDLFSVSVGLLADARE